MSKTLLFAGCALLLASTSGCAAVGQALSGTNAAIGSAATGIATTQTDQLNALATGFGKVLDDLNERCNGNAGLTWNPPAPPIPNLNVNCPIGQGSGSVSLKTLQSLNAPPK